MAALRIIVTVVYVIICVALTIIVLMQESKTQGLSGAISGIADTYWGRNKGRSLEGALNKGTTVLAICFVALSFLLNLKW
jgi:preprotein translocase subunit SecG